jgi:hypothetical protein
MPYLEQMVKGVKALGLESCMTLGFEAGFVACALRAIFTIFRAGAGFDRQQGADLHLARIKVLTMDLLCFE